MTAQLRFRFSTKYYDPELSLYYYGYRFYDSDMHRWLNRDPMDEKGGENLYAFCKNSPYNLFDILGREPDKADDDPNAEADSKYFHVPVKYRVWAFKTTGKGLLGRVTLFDLSGASGICV